MRRNKKLEFGIKSSRVLSILSTKWHEQGLRSQLDLPIKAERGLRIELATSPSDFDRITELVNAPSSDNMVQATTKKAFPFSKSHLLPTSLLLVLKLEEEIIGTASLLFDGPLGLSLEESWSFDSQPNQSIKTCELSFLTIANSTHIGSQHLVHTFLRFLLDYCENVAGADRLICDAKPAWKNILTGIYCFKALNLKSKQPASYGPRKSNPVAIDLGLHLKSQIFKNYSKNPTASNLFQFMYKQEVPSEINPKSISSLSIGGSPCNMELVDYLLNDRRGLVASLTEEDVNILHHVYVDPFLRNFIPKLDNTEIARKNIRYSVNARAKLLSPAVDLISIMKITEVSLDGLSLSSDKNFEPDEIIKILIEHEGFTPQELKLRVCWKNPEKKMYGFRVEGHSLAWSKLIEKVHMEFYDAPEKLKYTLRIKNRISEEKQI